MTELMIVTFEVGRTWTDRFCRSDRVGPVVADATPVERQVLERVEAVEVVDRNLRDGVRFGEPEIDGDAPAPFGIVRLRKPVRHAAAFGTEVELERLAADVGPCVSGDPDGFVFVVVGPQHAVTPARRAVARRRSVGLTVELPAHGTK